MSVCALRTLKDYFYLPSVQWHPLPLRILPSMGYIRHQRSISVYLTGTGDGTSWVGWLHLIGCNLRNHHYKHKVELAVHFKESFSFKTRMPGTVKCRPTVAYWVQIDGINIATELITRYYLNETLIQCCFNVRPTSATLAQHWNARHLYDIYAM